MRGSNSWARRAAATVAFIVTLSVSSIVAGLVLYFIASRSASIPLLPLSSTVSFGSG
jgi:hypothetical protein